VSDFQLENYVKMTRNNQQRENTDNYNQISSSSSLIRTTF